MQLSKCILVLLIAVIFSSCGEEKKDGPTDTTTSGTIDIAVDETYRPIIEEQLKVFDSSYPDANIKAQYKPESECIRDFMAGKVKLVLVTRDLLESEKQQLLNNKVVSTSLPVAKDAVAIILNKAATDTTMSMSKLKGILTGQYTKKYTVVFDNQGSSTVRYVLDSIIPGEKLGANVFAAKSNEDVIKYIEKNEDAIGFVGVSFVSDMEDPEGMAFINNVRVVTMYNDTLQKYYQPYQAYIAPNWYPLTRKLYYIHSQTYPGLAAGFANFLSKDRGQLIFKQARLFPLRSNIIFREAAVNP
jgi:phosphate transport system substrate-binding protein